MELLRSQFLFGRVVSKYFQDIKDELQETYNISDSKALSSRLACYAGLIGGALQVQMQYAITQGKQSFDIEGTITHITGVYPFEVFRPYIEEVAKSLCPGTQVSFGDPKTGRFLAQDMKYLPFTVTLPSDPTLAYPSGLTTDRVKLEVIGGGLSTGYWRYPHMLLFMHQHLQELPRDRPPNILLVGAGLIKDPDGSIQCPQLHEIGAVTQCGEFSEGFKLTVFDKDPDLLDQLEDNFANPGKATHPIRYDINALTYMSRSTQFTAAAEYEQLRAEMFEGMEEFTRGANISTVQGDLRDLKGSNHLERYDWIIETNSITNVFRGIDGDAGETKGMIDMLANQISLLHPGGYLFVDVHALKIIEERLGKGTIDSVIVPLLEYACKSELHITRLDRPVAKRNDGMSVITAYVRQGNNLYASPVVTHRVFVIQRGNHKSELNMSAVSRLQAHVKKSMKFAKTAPEED